VIELGVAKESPNQRFATIVLFELGDLLNAVSALAARQTSVKLNCAAIPRGLLEASRSAEKGAFTGAVTQRVGRFELKSRSLAPTFFIA